MGQGSALTRRRHLLGAAASLAGLASAGCNTRLDAVAAARWLGAGHERGHRLRSLDAASLTTTAAQPKRAHVLVLGAGVAGLAAARALMQSGVDDLRVLELEDEAGGNSRATQLGGMACPLGAHYLPLPGAAAREVQQLLFELGLARSEHGRTVYDERHLCHSPQERLFFAGAWHEGLLPPAAAGSPMAAQYRRFAGLVAQARRDVGFAMPSLRAPFGPGHAALDAVTFSHWLEQHDLRDERLHWYLDYCCRDDYGAGAHTVSAWAGLHYFASRHGFAYEAYDAPREPLLTWPQGNAWLTQALAAPLGERLLSGRVVLRVSEARHEVQVLAQNEHSGELEDWRAQRVVLAMPLFVSRRVLINPPPPLAAALAAALSAMAWAPWLVANLHLREPLLQRTGAEPAWDNVIYQSNGLGYVDAMHQSLRSAPGPTVLTAYWALPIAQRSALLHEPASTWAQRVLADLTPTHPDLQAKLQEVVLTRHGHAMSVPLPGVRSSAALAALRAQRGRIRFAHADLAGYSVFEEAYTAGWLAAA